MNELKFRTGAEKVTFKQVFQYTARGIQIIRKLQPLTMERKCIIQAIEVVTKIKAIAIIFFTDIYSPMALSAHALVVLYTYCSVFAPVQGPQDEYYCAFEK